MRGSWRDGFRSAALVWLCGASACDAPEPAAPPAAAAATELAVPETKQTPAVSDRAPAAPTKVRPARAGEEIAIPPGEVRLGSLPGEQPRRPSSEADAIPVRVPAFHIDRLPHPNDPEAKPTVLVDRAQAAALCAEAGKRLCHEIEWERACKGDEGRTYPTVNDRWSDPPCGSDELACATPFQVLQMGVVGREWTASDATAGLGDTLRTAVVRGAAPDEGALGHRCAARDAATPDSRSDTLTFRCCRGPVPELRYPVEPARERFELKPMDDDEARSWLGQFSQIRDLAQHFEPFSGDDYATALAKGGKSKETIAPWIPLEHPLIWSPVHGEQVWVLSGKTPAGAVVLFAYALGDGSFRFGGSFELENEPDPVAIAFNPDHPEHLLWSSCWGCGGEGGAIELREDGRVVIVQR